MKSWEFSPFGGCHTQQYTAARDRIIQQKIEKLEQKLTEARANDIKELERKFEDKIKNMEQEMQIQAEKHKKDIANQREKIKKAVQKGMEAFVASLGENDLQEFSDYPNTYETLPQETAQTDPSFKYEEIKAHAVKWNSTGDISGDEILRGPSNSKFKGSRGAAKGQGGGRSGGNGLGGRDSSRKDSGGRGSDEKDSSKFRGSKDPGGRGSDRTGRKGSGQKVFPSSAGSRGGVARAVGPKIGPGENVSKRGKGGRRSKPKRVLRRQSDTT